ncbi:UTRA domain-containing protein [Secundilactobacillus mixtipabuli]|uniref:GntR family transcriptional regulator n=1 Tax=Secundilactobacillus mixtipabuli TaxID=1435342 RepID=A0A1Z5IAW7_9LACO|nr:UTRA domain-containing protein [Secundilactobacillus mixtipabuli]GAW98943.1 GntR family transcriptional regulator [Secundilactobacillus mixtipabuli]
MLSKQSAIPLYKQVKSEILSDIRSSVYKVGETIPTEIQLEKRYNTSRITIRKAINQLVSEGVLLKKQGKGTFVQPQKVKRNLLDLVSYTSYMKETGQKPDAVIRVLEVKPADAGWSKILHIIEGDPIIRLARTMDLGQNNSGYEVSYYSLERFPDLDKRITEGASVTKILNEQYDTFGNSSEQTLNVISASQQIADYLKLEIGSPIYQLDRTVYEDNGSVMYSAVMYYDVNKVSFSVNTKER